MTNDKMREEFEAVLREDCESSGIDAPDLRVSPCVLDDGAVIYINDMTQACWWAYRKGWQVSRAALVIELPKVTYKQNPDPETDVEYRIRCEMKAKLEAVGVSYS